MNIYEEISKYEKTKMEAIKESKVKEPKQMNIDPECYVAREIEYQIALLHEILDKLKFLESKMGMNAKNFS